MAGDTHKYKFLNREYQPELGLNTIATDYRHYDASLGRFNVMDALSESAYSQTPYRYGFNNPTYWTDPTGLFESAELAAIYASNTLGISSAQYTISGTDYSGYILHVVDGTFAGQNFYESEFIFVNDLSELTINQRGGGGSLSSNDSRVVYDGLNYTSYLIDSGQIIYELGNARVSGKILGTAGHAINITKVGTGAYIIYSERNSEKKTLSVGEYAYDTTGVFTATVAGTIIGLEFGSVPGAATGFTVGVAFDFGKMLYDGYLWIQHEAGVWRNNMQRSLMSNPYYW